MNSIDLQKQNDQHIDDVKNLLENVITGLRERAKKHDHTKLTVIGTNKLLTALNDNSEEAWKAWKEYHFKQERHHPEFHTTIRDMNLIDLLEMVADGAAAQYRRKGDKVDYDEQVEFFKKKGFNHDIACILANTFMAMNMVLQIGG